MARSQSASTPRSAANLPACYATVLPGLEEVAAEEVRTRLSGNVKRSRRGVVVFRVGKIDQALLELRTTEDVFLLAWGTDELSRRAEDLRKIRAWTAHDADWSRLLQYHHLVRRKPKGKPTYRLVTQMSGAHAYRRSDAGEALARGLAGKLPSSWRPAAENAAVEVWLTIDGPTAVCGVRLSDRTMRHRSYKAEHVAASLRPSLAAAMVQCAEPPPAGIVLDPMCGAGTILAEWLSMAPRPSGQQTSAWGGDRDLAALRAARINLRPVGRAFLIRWDAGRLPIADGSVHRVVSNPPFGKRLGRPEEIRALYLRVVAECHRVLARDGKAVFLVSDMSSLRAAARRVGWQMIRALTVRVLGQRATVSVWRTR